MRIIMPIAALAVLFVLPAVIGCGPKAEPATTPTPIGQRAQPTATNKTAPAPNNQMVTTYSAPAPTSAPPPAPTNNANMMTNDGMRRITSKNGYYLDIPASWVEEKINVPNADLAFAYPAAQDYHGIIADCVTFYAVLLRELTLDECLDAAQKGVKEKSKFSLVSISDINGEIPMKKMIYTAEVEKDLDGKVALYLMVKGLNMYMIMCTGDPQMFNQLEPRFDTIARSFRLQ